MIETMFYFQIIIYLPFPPSRYSIEIQQIKNIIVVNLRAFSTFFYNLFVPENHAFKFFFDELFVSSPPTYSFRRTHFVPSISGTTIRSRYSLFIQLIIHFISCISFCIPFGYNNFYTYSLFNLLSKKLYILFKLQNRTHENIFILDKTLEKKSFSSNYSHAPRNFNITPLFSSQILHSKFIT